MSTDDDILSAPIPEPDDEATPSERARAKTFADLVDKTLSGRTPPAMSADDRALLEVATVIRAAHGNTELPQAKQRSLVEDALRQAIGQKPSAGSSLSTTPIMRGRARRMAPWLIAGTTTLVAAAALLLLWLRPHGARDVTTSAQQVPLTWKSRPSDPLIGPIARERAGDASARIDYIFADRLDGYRERRLSRGGSP
jgi:hypothetical protein